MSKSVKKICKSKIVLYNKIGGSELMKIISINAGSSSLKFKLYNMDEEKVIAKGNFERIGLDGSFYTITFNGEKIKSDIVLLRVETNIHHQY